MTHRHANAVVAVLMLFAVVPLMGCPYSFGNDLEVYCAQTGRCLCREDPQTLSVSCSCMAPNDPCRPHPSGSSDCCEGLLCEQGACCLPVRSTCLESSQCCSGQQCEKAVCCLMPNMACQVSTDCCPGLACFEGRCRG